MWATIIDKEKGLYKIDNIPFYASIATDDIVFAEYDEQEQRLTYRETVTDSGNSIIQIVIMDKKIAVDTVREIFNKLGCESEQLNDSYFSMEVPASISYAPIKNELNKLQSEDVIDYAEPCLGVGHQY
ncbi:MAG: DUF4265 domain-containing protein [Bacteroidota bacterium]